MLKFLPQGFVAFCVLRVHWNARYRTDLHTLGFVKVAYAFGAAGRVNLVNFWPHKNGLIGAFWLTDIAVDALVGNHQCHGALPAKTNFIGWIILCWPFFCRYAGSTYFNNTAPLVISPPLWDGFYFNA
jgi:hypothetical protein